jgi:hypothetical protein
MFKRGPLAGLPIDERTARAYQRVGRRGRLLIALIVYASVLVGCWLDWIVYGALLSVRGPS